MQADQNNSDFMPKIDLNKDRNKLKYTDFMYMKQAEEIAIHRAHRYRNTRNRCVVAGVSLACCALGIYLYTIHAVRQETFLDNLDEPEKIIKNPNSEANIS